MEWNRLLTLWRLGCPKDETWQENFMARHEFQRDFDRVLFSPHFRRLNGKTQVFPFPQIDGIHNRLTHSLECASVGRSLGTLIGNELEKAGKIDGDAGWEIGALVSAACLAHDIGNPPFGHSGEKAIAEFFSDPFGERILSRLSPEQREDFVQFDGNAMGFHFLTYTNPRISAVDGGLGLTYPTLAAFSKYPRVAAEHKDKSKRSENKPGLFTCHIGIYEEITRELGIKRKEGRNGWYRHPLAFVTEAADDICYNIIDLEDGYIQDLVTYEQVSTLLISIAELSENVRDQIDNTSRIHDPRNKLGYLRSLAIHSLIYQVLEVFLKNENSILTGEFDQALVEHIPAKPILEEINKLSVRNIYSHSPVLQIEAAGFQVLPGLLELFFTALTNKEKKSGQKILSILGCHHVVDYDSDPYNAVLSIVSYVAGMTDAFALDTYRNLKGIPLPA